MGDIKVSIESARVIGYILIMIGAFFICGVLFGWIEVVGEGAEGIKIIIGLTGCISALTGVAIILLAAKTGK